MDVPILKIEARDGRRGDFGGIDIGIEKADGGEGERCDVGARGGE